MKTEVLYRVDALHYCAGFVARNGKVVEAAPILGWTRGKSVEDVLAYFKRKRYKVEVLSG